MTIFLSRISMNLYELIYIFKKIFKHLFISLYRVLVAHGLFVWLQFSSVHSLSCARLFATPWTAAHQASLSITPSWSFLKLMSIVSVMPSNHLILCPLFLLPSIFPSIRVFSSESALRIRWPKYWFQLQHQSFHCIFSVEFL